MAITDYAIPASALHDAYRAQGVNAVTTVPDFVQFALHDAMKSDEDVRYIECSAENQALTTAMGLYVGGMSPMVMMQNQGLLNCLNTLRSVGLDAGIPLVLSVGAFGREFANLGQPITESRRACVNLVEPVMAAMGIPFFHLETTQDLPKVAEAFATAKQQQRAAVVHIGHYPSWT
ncbi:thiamine pyrophosphate-binding protein [Planktotalea sp.]|uniref:thiamine pyrophosphate-binding protein n=1 Tax=Planktotalea sp. TaxID=2029877 RepID=UPI003D6A9511